MWGELCLWGFGLALLPCCHLNASHVQLAGRTASQQVCYLPPFFCLHICHPGRKIFHGSWHGKLNSCLNQQEAAPVDGCPAFGSNIALVIDRANSACPLCCYNLITCTLPRTGLSLPARDVFILGCPGSESGWGCSGACASCATCVTPSQPSSGGAALSCTNWRSAGWAPTWEGKGRLASLAWRYPSHFAFWFWHPMWHQLRLSRRRMCLLVRVESFWGALC